MNLTKTKEWMKKCTKRMEVKIMQRLKMLTVMRDECLVIRHSLSMGKEENGEVKPTSTPFAL